MTRYFFHVVGHDFRNDDGVGCEFENVEAAYLEASRAALEIGAEMIARQEDPSGLRLEICDERLGLVMELSLRELLRRPTPPWPSFRVLRERMEENLTRGRAANAEIVEGIQTARARLSEIRRTMGLLEE